MENTMLNNFPTSFNTDKGNNVELFNSIQKELDYIYDLDKEHLSKAFITSSYGIYLDKIGLLFGLSRSTGESDETYKSKLLSLSKNEDVLSGTKSSIISNLIKDTDLSEDDIKLVELRDLVFSVEISIQSEAPSGVSDSVNFTKAAGILLKSVEYFAKYGIITVNLANVNGRDYLL